MSLLTIIQDAAIEMDLNRPSSVVNSVDPLIQQLLALAKRDIKDLALRFDWQDLTVETSFTTVATEEQAALPDDFLRMVDESMNNRTQHWRVIGPLSGPEWQRRLSLGAQVGVVNSFRIRGNAFLFFPTPPAGDSIYYEYITSKLVVANDGTTFKTTFTADTDMARIDETIVTLGVKWRFLRAKGLDYSEEFRSYEAALESVFGSDGARGPVDMTGDMTDWTIPAIPDGSWNI